MTAVGRICRLCQLPIKGGLLWIDGEPHHSVCALTKGTLSQEDRIAELEAERDGFKQKLADALAQSMTDIEELQGCWAGRAELEAINADLLAALEWYQKVVSQFADEKSVLVAENGRALAEQLASDAGQRAKAAIAKDKP